MSRFLQNKKTGQIVHSNPILEKRNDMRPCKAPFETESTPKAEAPKPEPEKEKIELLPQPEGEALIKEWFGRTVDKVTLADLYAYAKEQTGEDFPEGMKKLQIVSRLAVALKDKE